jgi:hypothetical protein
MAAAVLRRHPPSATDAAWVSLPRLERQQQLNTYVVLPAIGEVVLVEKSLTDTQSKVGQPYLAGIVGKANAAEVSDTVLAAVNDEAVQVLVTPGQSRLQGGMQVGEGVVAADEQAPPDQKADAAKDDAQLVDNGLVGRFRFRHVLIVRPDSSRPRLPRFFHSRTRRRFSMASKHCFCWSSGPDRGITV